jgi:hypothetical protein
MQMLVIFNSVAIVVLVLVQYLTIRQVGVTLQRLGPVGARTVENEGPRTGEDLSVPLAAVRDGLPQFPPDILYLFLSFSCSICRQVRAGADALGPVWKDKVQIVLLYDEPAGGISPDALAGTPNPFIAVPPKLRESLGIDSVPFAVRVDRSHQVLGKGLINTTSHIESLLEITPVDAAARTFGPAALVEA